MGRKTIQELTALSLPAVGTDLVPIARSTSPATKLALAAFPVSDATQTALNAKADDDLNNVTDADFGDKTFTGGFGDVARSLSSRTRDRPHAFDYIPAALQSDILAGTSTTDVAPYIQDALDEAGTLDAGWIYLPSGVMYWESPVVFPNVAGVGLVGAGITRGLVESPTRIVVNHSAGPALRLQAGGQLVEGVLLDASSTRTAGAAGQNYGIIIEPPDTSGAAANGCRLINVGVRDMPTHGFVTSANCNQTVFDGCQTRTNLGHAFVLDDGTEVTSTGSARTYFDRPGMISLMNCRTFDDYGHALKAGNLENVTNGNGFGAYRIYADNFEAASAANAGALVQPAQIWVNGENIRISGSAFAGRSNTLRAVAASGRDHRYLDNRYIETSGALHLFRGDTDTNRETVEIILDGGVMSSAAIANPLVLCDGLTTDFNAITVRWDIPANVTTYITPGVASTCVVSSTAVSDATRAYTVESLATVGDATVGDDLTVTGTIGPSVRTQIGSIYGSSVTLADDAAVSTINLLGGSGAAASGILMIGTNLVVNGAGETNGGLVFYRTNSATSPMCSTSSTGIVTAAIDATLAYADGAQPATTGGNITDGKVTILACTDNNKLFLYNRSGGTLVFTMSLVSSSLATLA